MPLNVYLVDDDPLILDLLEAAITRARPNWVLTRLPVPEKAVEAVRTSAPDLLVLDANMPGLTGHQVLDTLGAAAPPTVVLTGEDGSKDHEWQRFSCVRGILRKPFSVRAIAAELEEVLQRCTPPEKK